MYQVIIIRSDLGMRCGKKIAQGAHASVRAAIKVYKDNPELYTEWNSDGHKKVSLRVSGEEKLIDIYQLADALGYPCSLIWDIGLTQIEPSYTALAVGPCDDDLMKKLTKGMKLV